jgi:small subunit ribosomal protein S13
MINFLGVNINSNKKVFMGLQIIKGVGLVRAKYVCKISRIAPTRLLKDLTLEQIKILKRNVNKHFWLFEKSLVHDTGENIKILNRISCFRGLRHRHNFPVRGQRTRTNAKTSRTRSKYFLKVKKRKKKKNFV